MSQSLVTKYGMGAHVGRRILNIGYEHILPNRTAFTMALASRAVLHHVNIHAYYPIYNTSYTLRGKFGRKKSAGLF